MTHGFIYIARPPAVWSEALPTAARLARAEWLDGRGFAVAPAVLWWQLAPGESVAMALETLATRLPAAGTRLVLLSDTPEDAAVLQAITGGAAGYGHSHAAPAVLRQMARVVENGGFWLGPAVLQGLIRGLGNLLPPATRDTPTWQSRLSERERQVAERVAAGASNKEIARDLAVTERTIKAHLTAIFDKLDVRDRLQLALRVNGRA